mmetsp:Transcript_32601/g.77333  ORF Transcript_32601/g.77333 Transcript_32601/m.77333 type:complete len:406 (-) Transcript_32601:14-1231(-)
MREASVGHDCPIVISDSGESSDGTASGAEAAKPTSQQSVGSLGCSQGSGQRGQLTLLLKQQQLAPGNRSSQPMDSARSRYGKKQGTAAASGRKKAPAKGKGMLLQLTASTSAAAAPKQPCPPPVQSEPRAPFLSTEPSAKHLVAPGGSEFPAAAAGDADAGASWSTKYAPESAAELVVHKKKVDELRAWMQHCAGKCGLPAAGCLLLTGPPGCGKTAAVCLLASEQGLSVTEWVPPAGVTWEEHQRNHRGGSAEPSPSPSSSGRRFHSKLDEFDDYVGRSTLFASLQLQRAITSKRAHGGGCCSSTTSRTRRTPSSGRGLPSPSGGSPAPHASPPSSSPPQVIGREPRPSSRARPLATATASTRSPRSRQEGGAARPLPSWLRFLAQISPPCQSDSQHGHRFAIQ